MTESERVGICFIGKEALDFLFFVGEDAPVFLFSPPREVENLSMFLFSRTPSDDRLVDDLLRMFVRSTPHGRSCHFGETKDKDGRN